LHRGNVLDSLISAEYIKNAGAAEAEEVSGHDVIQRTREEYGRYFGICGSYHHLKACLCKYCSSCPGGTGMFCARGAVVRGEEKIDDCLCETCELFKKFRFEGDHFCRLKEKHVAPDRRRVHPDICTDFQTSAGTIRVCVLGEQNMHSK